MSSSQQQSTNSNINQSQTTHTHPQESNNVIYNDYEYDPSLEGIIHNNSNVNVEQLNTDNNISAELYSYNDENYDVQDDENLDEIEAELDGKDEIINNEQYNDNDYYDKDVYSDDVQNAFANYENENLKGYNRNESTWDNFPYDEQDEMFEQMQECERYMLQEYSTAEMPQDLVERVEKSNLNPDAIDFQPSWSVSTPTTDNQPIIVESWLPCVAKKQE